jgi:hypothetical protein
LVPEAQMSVRACGLFGVRCVNEAKTAHYLAAGSGSRRTGLALLCPLG